MFVNNRDNIIGSISKPKYVVVVKPHPFAGWDDSILESHSRYNKFIVRYGVRTKAGESYSDIRRYLFHRVWAFVVENKIEYLRRFRPKIISADWFRFRLYEYLSPLNYAEWESYVEVGEEFGYWQLLEVVFEKHLKGKEDFSEQEIDRLNRYDAREKNKKEKERRQAEKISQREAQLLQRDKTQKEQADDKREERNRVRISNLRKSGMKYLMTRAYISVQNIVYEELFARQIKLNGYCMYIKLVSDLDIPFVHHFSQLDFSELDVCVNICNSVNSNPAEYFKNAFLKLVVG